MKKQFSLTRAALSKSGRAKANSYQYGSGMSRDGFAAKLFWTCLLEIMVGLIGQGVAGAAGFGVNINFQTTNSANLAGYLPDAGYAFGDRRNGYAYGWNVDNVTNAFQRNLYSDQRIDTGNKMQPAGEALNWQIEVPNGCYDVLLVAADPADTGGQGTCYNIYAESAPVIANGTPSSSQWIFGTNTHVQVRVTNRRLTVSNGPDATNNSICFIQIQQVAPIYWGAAVYDNPTDSSLESRSPWDYISQSQPGVLGYFEGHTGKKVSILSWGDSWNESYFWWNTNGMSDMWARGTIPRYDLLPSGISLSNIIAGAYDSYLTNWARQAKAYGKPFFLRFAHEMNGDWYSWSESNSINAGCAPGTFTNMWRHVHDIFANVGCTNATWVWCIDHYLTNSDHIVPLSRLYPGDAYVDWLGLDIYNQGDVPPYSGLWFTNLYLDSYVALTNLAPSKPIMVCEVATLSDLSSTPKPAWIADALMQLPAAFPDIRAFVWFDWNAGDTNDDWPIEGGENVIAYTNNPPIEWASVDAFSNGVASPFYEANIFTNQANLTASPIQPIVLLKPPPTLAASASNATVQLSWSAVAGASNYNVYRSASSSNGTFTLLTSVTGTNCTDTTSSFCTTYYYMVAAENLAGESLDSTEASVTTPCPTLATRLINPETIQLAWPASFGGFMLQSSSNLPTGNWQNVAAVPNVVNGQMQVIVSPTNSNQFYRLVLP